MSDGEPATPGWALRTWRCVAASAFAAWLAYGAIGVTGTGVMVMVACDGEAHPARDRPALRPRKPARPRPAPAAASPEAPPPRARLYPDLGAALLALAAEQPRVIGVGELHVRTDRPLPGVSALARFSREALPAVADRVSDLVVETWTVAPGCVRGVQASKQIERSMKRPETTGNEIGALFGVSRERAITAHVMRLTCDDLTSLTATDKLDAERLLGLVTRELDRVTRSAVRYRDEHHESRPLILVYGGALHNDLYPFESTKAWSYGLAVDAATGGRYVELDVFAPELVEGDPLYEHESWYPLVAKADGRGVTLVERAPRSYVAILPRS